MKLNLMNLNSLIETENLKRVKTTRLFSRNVQVDGLFSEEIFGKFGSAERRKTFAYVNLNTKIIHPEAFEHIFTSLSTDVSKFILNKQKYIIKNGRLTPNEEGVSGVTEFIKNFKKLDLSAFKKKEEVKYINDNLNKLFIDKWLIMPAGNRDIQFIKGTNKSMIQYTELNELYESLIRNTNSIVNLSDDVEIQMSITNTIQISVLNINRWFKERMKGKHGLLRNGLMKKTVDYSGRLVITTDNTLDVGEIGLPWQVVLRLFEPFAIHRILKDQNYLSLIQEFLKSDVKIDNYTLKQLIKKLNVTPDILSPLLKDYFIDVAKGIVKDKLCLIKRDPVENRNSYVAVDVRIEASGFVMSLNPIELDRQGADHDGDQMAIFPIFTKEATEEARLKMHPKYSKSVWYESVTNNKIAYRIMLDAAVSIYNATLK
jgi:DNA-directed RNA polymerase beta' subunit